MQAAHCGAGQKTNNYRQQTCGDEPMPVERPAGDQCKPDQNQAGLRTVE
jgi:hypothetical protein